MSGRTRGGGDSQKGAGDIYCETEIALPGGDFGVRAAAGRRREVRELDANVHGMQRVGRVRRESVAETEVVDAKAGSGAGSGETCVAGVVG